MKSSTNQETASLSDVAKVWTALRSQILDLEKRVAELEQRCQDLERPVQQQLTMLEAS